MVGPEAVINARFPLTALPQLAVAPLCSASQKGRVCQPELKLTAIPDSTCPSFTDRHHPSNGSGFGGFRHGKTRS